MDMAAISVNLPVKSTVFSPNAQVRRFGQSTEMERLPDILRRIDERLKATGLSQDKASKAAGKPDAIRNIRRAVKEGQGGVNLRTLEALAPVLQTSSAWLLGDNSKGDALETVLDDLRAKRDEIDRTIKTLEAELLTKKQKPGKIT